MAVPIAALETFLRDLHDGTAQDAATVKIALVVWRQAVARGDTVVAQEMLAAATAAADRVAGGVTVLLATGRGWLDGGARPEPNGRGACG